MYLSAAGVVAWLRVPAGAAPGCGLTGDAPGSVPDRWLYSRDAYLSWMVCKSRFKVRSKKLYNSAPCVPFHCITEFTGTAARRSRAVRVGRQDRLSQLRTPEPGVLYLNVILYGDLPELPSGMGKRRWIV
eukprot:6198072-Pleurochrysis_carterae.AAC.4